MTPMQNRDQSYQRELQELRRIGDQMQSAASRLNEHLSKLGISLPYEEMHALLEVRSTVDQWTEVRRKSEAL